MDIWKWVNEAEKAAISRGDYRLAELIDVLPSYVVDDEYKKVDAIIPEGLRLARQLNHKWLEVFFRHWNLQSLVLYREQVKDMLPEAINLVDFCHQEDTKDCPQSICVVQDLAHCYESIDYLGYAEERLAVAAETLKKIDMNWPCFSCIGSEYTSALIDMGKPDSALEWIDDARKKARAMRTDEHESLFLSNKINALIDMERWQEAFDCAKANNNEGGGDGFIRDKKNDLMVTLAALERYDEALKNRLNFDEIKQGVSYFVKWSLGTYLLVKAEKLENNWQIDSQLDYMAEKMMSQGVLRKAIDVSHWQAELAILRKRPLTVQRCIDRIDSLISELPKILGARDDLDKLRARAGCLDESLTQWQFANSEALLDSLNDDVEDNLAKLMSGRHAFPDAENIVIEQAETLKQLNRTVEADAVLSHFLAENPNAAQCILLYGLSLLKQSLYAELEQFLAQYSKDNTEGECLVNWYWLQARYAEKQNDLHAVKKHLDSILAVYPNAYNCLNWLAVVECELGEYEKSIELWNHILKHFEDEKQVHWDRMVPSVLAGRWDLVRESIKILELNYKVFDADVNSPIDLELELIRLEIEDENGDKQEYIARRTGPVTARIVAITSSINEKQLYGNEYVFNPMPLNQEDSHDSQSDQSNQCSEDGDVFLFSVIKETKKANYEVFEVDGFHPGQDIWDMFVAELEKHNAVAQVRSNKEYTLEYNGEIWPAVYAFIALPETLSKKILTQLLNKYFSALPMPLTWPGLLEAMGEEEQAELHREIQQDYDIC